MLQSDDVAAILTLWSQYFGFSPKNASHSCRRARPHPRVAFSWDVSASRICKPCEDGVEAELLNSTARRAELTVGGHHHERDQESIDVALGY